MRIRYGFVSNSSSSSFVIAFREDSEPCPHCGRRDPSIDALRAAVDNNTYDGNCWRTDGFEGVMEYFKDCERPKVEMDKIVDQMEELKEQGYKFAVLEVSNHDGNLHNMINNSKNIVVIERGD